MANAILCCLLAAMGAAALLFPPATEASSIPMWEYLTKDEKTSYLYAMFKSQVDKYCSGSDMQNCNQELMRYGLKKLKGMSEDHLDLMDPYQRGASNIIWEQMMEGHPMPSPRTPTTTTTTTTPLPNSYDQTFEDLGSKPAESARYDTIVAPTGNRLLPLPLHESYNTGRPVYVRLPTRRTEGVIATFSTPSPPLEGGYVVRVHPDGRPVVGGNRVGEDDDLRQYWLSKQKLPGY